MRFRCTISIASALLAAGPADAAAPYEDQVRAELIGVLTLTRLSVSFDGVSAREAFRTLSAAINTPILGRYNDDRVGHGIDPDLLVTVHLDDVPARYVLELILDQVALDEPCTWQLRRGSIEVGTKERLSVPAASETRIYRVADLLLEAPYFESPFAGAMVGGSWTFHGHPYATAALTRPSSSGRKKPDQLAGEIAEGIVEMIEPGNWDYGQDDGDPEFDDEIPGSLSVGADRRTRPRAGKIARLRIWRDRFVIAAPDFIHRQIVGYPPPITPAPLGDDERRERSLRASSEGAQVVVLTTTGRTDR